ncbi:hypothetical protein COD09_08935 [Bacillus cereus]|uniref:Uncharacterized protein n=1 Tax=Bacillus cereus TaxID=1396 RepID=A0A2C1DUS7_BACCE|nr:hypothetical protein COD09_08935 [Bacillus cereus]
MVGGFTSSCEAKRASTSEAPSPSHSERAAYAFYLITKFGFLFKL